MQYTLFLSSLLFAWLQVVASQQQQAAAGVNAAATANASFTVPPCFVNCATKVATEIKCKDISDFACYCTKQEFMLENAKCTLSSCPELASNTTLSAANFEQLKTTCKATTGHFNLTVPTPSDLTMMSSANVTAGAQVAAGQQASSTPPHHASSASKMTTSPIVASVVLGMAATLIGSFFLF